LRKRAWAAALLVAGSAALGGIAWWFLAARDARDDSEHRPAAPAPVRGDAPVAAESAAAAASATRTENRDFAAPSPAANRGADAFASGATNWDPTSKTSGIELDVFDAWVHGTELLVARADARDRPLDVRLRTTFVGEYRHVDLEAPARYVVTLRDVPGFEDPPPLEVDVAPGRVAPVVFSLATPR
jgi:hypothetical protein